MDLSKALGYCRVSTQKQYTEGHGLERYIERLKQYGLREEQIYWDIESGASEKRTGYKKVLDAVKRGEVNKIIVPCFDRFTRSPLGWEQAKEELIKYGCELVSMDGASINLETPDGLFTSRILAAMAAQVRDKNKYASIQGHKFFQENKKAYKAIFGYKKIGDKLLINNDEYKAGITVKEVALEIIDLFLELGTLEGVCETLCKRYGRERNPIQWLDFSRSGKAIKVWLENPILCGKLRYNRFAKDKEKEIIIQSDHEPLIDSSKWQDIQSILERNPKGRGAKCRNPLVSLCKCGHCGSRMRMYTNYGREGSEWRRQYLQCLGARDRAGSKIICDKRKFYLLDAAVDAAIDAMMQKAEFIASKMNGTTIIEFAEEIDELEGEILSLKRLGDKDYEPVIKAKELKLEKAILTQVSANNAQSRQYSLYIEVLRMKNEWRRYPKEELAPAFQDLIVAVNCFTGDDGTQSFSFLFK